MFIRKIIIAVIAVLLSTVVGVKAQESPVLSKGSLPLVLESLVGNRGGFFEVVINKKFESVPKLGLFSVSNLVAEFDKKDFDDVMSQGYLTYNVVRGLDIMGGYFYTDVTGLRASAALSYTKANAEYTFNINPRIDLQSNPIQETALFVEYKPVIDTNWKYYYRLQGLYGFTPDNGDHARSYIKLRAGVTYKEVDFGLASNFDWYGPDKDNYNNIGVFVSARLY
ncbi:hypothetical protein NWE55_13165 [Myroides albus]|uniref:hypothetical protein n=1 Tax=Myroides albus TaxID=2562892 RepID=UPI002158C0B3|nr:hypothetical protein [Myroides albus]UVD79065.1 hypothetical protein NWE55_13165 [Myroides albus]